MLINCDLGECLTPNIDSKIMPKINMANIACGGHAGDKKSMLATVILAKKYRTTIGAHPSYIDKQNFGRNSIEVSTELLFTQLLQQIKTLENICINNNTKLHYIKPHGALYHDMMLNTNTMQVIINLINTINPKLKLVVQYGINAASLTIAKKNNITLLYEAFADRAYQGIQLKQRGKKGSVFNDKDKIISQFYKLSSNKDIDTICFHSDNTASVDALLNCK